MNNNTRLENPESNVLLLGDSILYDLGDFVFGNCVFENLSISGEDSFHLLERVDEINLNDSMHVFLMIGVNDIAIYKAPYKIVYNIEMIVRSLLPKVKSLTVLTLLNTSYAIRDNSRVKHVNMLILKRFNVASKLSVLDVNDIFNSHFGTQINYTIDGIHLNPSALKLLSDNIIYSLGNLDSACMN